MEVYLVRHAAQHVAEEDRFRDTGLTAAGEDQARSLAKLLREADFGVCLSSPMRRAVETARLLLEGREIPLRLDENLAEGHPGDLAGLSESEARSRYPDDFRLGRTVVARVAAMGRGLHRRRACWLHHALQASRFDRHTLAADRAGRIRAV